MGCSSSKQSRAIGGSKAGSKQSPSDSADTVSPESVAISVAEAPAASDAGASTATGAAATPAVAPAPESLLQLARSGDKDALRAALGPTVLLGGLLHAAAEEGHEGVVEVLLAAGALKTETDSDGQTALHAAVANARVEVAEVLTRDEPCVELSQPDNFSMTPLHLACEDGVPEMVALLLARGGDQMVLSRSKDPVETGAKSPLKQPMPGPGGTLQSLRESSSGGSLLFIAQRHSHSEAATLIKRASFGNKTELPERLSKRSNSTSSESQSDGGSQRSESDASPGARKK